MQRGPLRPLMVVCIVYLLLLAALFLLSAYFVFQILLLVVCTCGFAVMAWLSGCSKVHLPVVLSSRIFWISLMIPVILSAVGVFTTLRDYRALQATEQKTVQVTGVVERVYYATDSGASFLLDLKTVDGKNNGGKIRVGSNGNAIYANQGETVSGQVLIGTEELRFEYEENITYAFPDGIYAYAQAQEPMTVLGTKLTFRGICETINTWCRLQLYRYLPKEAADLSVSILLGDKSVISPEIKRDFRRIGVSHILAVSGLHFSILINGILFSMRKTGVPYRPRYIILLLLIFLYMGVTGFSPSVMRAGGMWIIACIASLVYAQPDGLISLFLAAAVLCVISPQAIFDVGFLLSVFATLGLIVLMPGINRFLYGSDLLRTLYLKPIRAVLLLLATTFAATIFTTPIMLLVFGELSVAAPLSNLLMHIPTVVLMYCVPLLLLLSLLGFLPPVQWILHFLSGVISGDTTLIAELAGWLSRIPHALIGVRYPFVFVLLVLFIAVFVVLYIKYRKILLAYPVFGVFLAALFLGIQMQAFFTRGDVAVSYSVNGKNDNITVVTDGRGMLIDASDGSWKNMRLAWDQLSEQNITSVDVCVLTHYHNKHTSSLSRLSETAVVESLVLPYPENEEELQICTAIRNIAGLHGTAVQLYRRGEDDILFGEAALTVFPTAYLSRSVQPVLGWSLRANAQTAVYLGGAAFETEGDGFAAHREEVLGECDYLMLGVHGPLYKAELPPLCGNNRDLRAVIAANDAVCALITDTVSVMPVYSLESGAVARMILEH